MATSGLEEAGGDRESARLVAFFRLGLCIRKTERLPLLPSSSRAIPSELAKSVQKAG